MTYIVTTKTGIIGRSTSSVEGILALQKRLGEYRANGVKVTSIDSLR